MGNITYFIPGRGIDITDLLKLWGMLPALLLNFIPALPCIKCLSRHFYIKRQPVYRKTSLHNSVVVSEFATDLRSQIGFDFIGHLFLLP